MSDENQEFIDEDSKDEKRPPTILEMLQYELRNHMAVALEYKKKIDEAKTDHKKKYYGKKLKKNNIEALKVITAIERVSKANKEKLDEQAPE